MKLKSKLIATIVSICAAIAVMGVGVWAATSQFTVQVTNKVNFTVNNLAGTITVTGAATINGAAQDENYTNKLNAVELYDSTDATPATTTDISVNGTVKYDGAGLFDEDHAASGVIDATTKTAVLSYTFVYDAPTAAGAGYTVVTITPGENMPTLNATGATIECTYSAGASTTGDLDAATIELYAAAGTDITVTITCTYTNNDLVSVVGSGSFDFDIKFESASEHRGTAIA